MQGTTDFILCRDGHCQFISKVSFCEPQKIFFEIGLSQEDVKLLEQEEKKEKKKVEESCTASKPTSAAKNEKEKVPPPTAPVEVATIAVTEDANIPHEVPGNIPDDPLPDILIKPQPDVKSFKVLSRPDGPAV